MSFSDWMRKIQDIIMPIENDEEEVSEVKDTAKNTTAQAQTQAQPQMQAQQTPNQAQNLMETMAAHRASMAGNSTFAQNSTGANYKTFKDARTERPNLKLIKAPEFVMKVYTPSDYSQINGIADDILAHKAAVVNYEYIRNEEQRRISDYIDGVCYAVDGTVTKISEKICLYVPAGISTRDIAALVASVRYH